MDRQNNRVPITWETSGPETKDLAEQIFCASIKRRPVPKPSNMENDHTKDETIFLAALELAPDQRAAYLSVACEGDPDVRRRVEALLVAAGEADPFFAQEPLRLALGRT